MKTLLTAIALTMTATAPALAFDPYDAKSGGIPLINQVEDRASYTFGFTGLQQPADHMIKNNKFSAQSAGTPLIGRNNGPANTFGFTGLQEPATYIIPQNVYDAKSNGGPLVR